jgi:hypothetical protein
VTWHSYRQRNHFWWPLGSVHGHVYTAAHNTWCEHGHDRLGTESRSGGCWEATPSHPFITGLGANCQTQQRQREAMGHADEAAHDTRAGHRGLVCSRGNWLRLRNENMNWRFVNFYFVRSGVGFRDFCSGVVPVCCDLWARLPPVSTLAVVSKRWNRHGVRVCDQREFGETRLICGRIGIMNLIYIYEATY